MVRRVVLSAALHCNSLKDLVKKEHIQGQQKSFIAVSKCVRLNTHRHRQGLKGRAQLAILLSFCHFDIPEIFSSTFSVLLLSLEFFFHLDAQECLKQINQKFYLCIILTLQGQNVQHPPHFCLFTCTEMHATNQYVDKRHFRRHWLTNKIIHVKNLWITEDCAFRKVLLLK